MENAVLFAFLVTLAAGLATAVGALIALFARHTNRKFLAVSLGFSAGVMIYVSFVEILPKALSYLSPTHGESSASALMAASFLTGLVGMAVLYRLIPELEHPALDESHTTIRLDEGAQALYTDKLLLRTGVGVALAVTLLNFPEGMATFFLTLGDPQVGLSVALAIAIHNIPEGIAVVIPIYYATRNRASAFGFGVISGLAEPIGAILGYLVLRPFMTDSLLGMIFAGVPVAPGLSSSSTAVGTQAPVLVPGCAVPFPAGVAMAMSAAPPVEKPRRLKSKLSLVRNTSWR